MSQSKKSPARDKHIDALQMPKAGELAPLDDGKRFHAESAAAAQRDRSQSASPSFPFEAFPVIVGTWFARVHSIRRFTCPETV